MKNKRAFTLIELILVIALIGIVLSMIFSPIIFSFKNFNNQSEKANVISDARATMDFLTREIRKADPETVDVDDGSLKIGSEHYELEDKILYKREKKNEKKNEKKVIEGIDNISIKIDADKITIEITIEDYELSSEIYLRKGEKY